MQSNNKFSTGSKYFELLTTAVAGGSTIRDAAAQAGCSESHGYRLSCSTEFKAKVAELRGQVTGAALGKLTNAATLAVDTLVELLQPTNEPATRMNAAKAILANLGPLSELSELRARLEAIESERKPKIKATA